MPIDILQALYFLILNKSKTSFIVFIINFE